ncbi:MAG: NYN domain-containing protein, partial [Olsenella sp.]|nr:NYN domain-containing protein [Olsenella sp.]
PPVSDARVKQPWDEHNRVFSKKNPSNVWSTEFQSALAGMRKVAMRMGEVRTANMHFNLKEDSLKMLLAKKITVDDLTERDFTLVGMKQSGVDMRIGLDVASLANERIVDQIILIAGDTDFVPVAKTARRAGVDFLIDPMGHVLPAELIRQVDGVEDLSNTLAKATSLQ